MLGHDTRKQMSIHRLVTKKRVGTGGGRGGSINHKPNANICEIITRQSISGEKAEVNTKSVNTSVSHAVAPFVRVVVHGLVGFLDDFVLDCGPDRRKEGNSLEWKLQVDLPVPVSHLLGWCTWNVKRCKSGMDGRGPGRTKDGGGMKSCSFERVEICMFAYFY